MSVLGFFLFLILIVLAFYGYLRVWYNWYRKVKILSEKKKGEEYESLKQAPGPAPWPILGNLALLGQYEVPFEGFTSLAKKYGDVYSLTLGSTRCLIVNSLEHIREVLNQNGKYFGGRPDFLRFHTLFGGDRNNSLALCDWSNLQQKRRNLARKHCSPRDASSFYQKMSDVGVFEMEELMGYLETAVKPGQEIYIKPILMQTCANMFSQYMCSTRFDYDDKPFQGIVHNFDEIFWEINQGYALDFMPWLAPFYNSHLKKLSAWSTEIRKFILDRIISQRERTIDIDEPERDFTDALLKSLIEDPAVDRDTIIYMLEDFLGGHSAIGNLVMLSLGYIARNPEIGRRIQAEVDTLTENGKRKVTLFDKDELPYTIATIFEVLRYSSSPIVPHVATEDATVAGYGVPKGTVVFINNYDLNTNPKYWDKPEEFNPDRFLEEINTQNATAITITVDTLNNNNVQDGFSRIPKNTKLRIKPNIPHFLPFSIGKRTCIGQNLVRGFSFIMLANIMQKYNVTSSQPDKIKTFKACVAVPPDTFSLALTPRQH